MLILIIILILVFGAGGGYCGHTRWPMESARRGGIGLGTILLILLIAYKLGLFR
jgi:hypothetical protein